MSLTAKSFLAMGLGAVFGVLIGDRAAMLGPLGSAFLQLLQMTVLPYLVVSLVLGIASIEPGLLRRLGSAMAVAFLVIWVVSVASVYCLGQAFPSDGMPSFHVDPEAGPTESRTSMVDMFIPSNPFGSLANGAVPAVVLFLILLSMHLVHHPGKQAVLDFLNPIQDSLLWLTSWLNTVVPYGVFVLMAQMAGTITVAELRKLSLFVGLYCFGSLVLTFWLLPLAVGLSTPYRYLALLRECWGGVALAIGSGSTYVALPTMMQNLRAMVSQGGEERTTEVEAVVPVAFNFPHAGTMFSFLFVLFAASAYGVAVSVWTHLKLIVAGIPALFSGGVFAMIFLLDMSAIPRDALPLFMNVQSIIVRVRSGLAAVTVMVVALWVHAYLTGKFRPRPLPLAALVGGTLGGFLLLALLIRPTLSHEASTTDLFRSQTLETKHLVFLQSPPDASPAKSARERVSAGLPLVASYLPEALPYSFSNAQGQPVGFHIAMAERLGRNLDVPVHLVPMDLKQTREALLQGRIDTFLGPMPLTRTSMRLFDFTRIYLEGRPYLLFKSGQDQDLEARVQAGDLRGLRVGTLEGILPEGADLRLLRGATTVSLKSPQEFEGSDLDAILLDQVLARAMELQNPFYFGLEIDTDPIVQFALPVQPGNDLVTVLDAWLQKVEKQGFLEEIEDQWLEGKFPRETLKRRPLLPQLLPAD